MAKLFVGGLHPDVVAPNLRAIFSKFGAVRDAFVVMDRESGASRGFGFVQMSNDVEAQAAITGLDRTEHQGKILRVNLARPKE